MIKSVDSTPTFGFYFMLIGGFAFLIVLFGTARRLGTRVTRILSTVSIVALTGFGLYQLYMGLFGLQGVAG